MKAARQPAFPSKHSPFGCALQIAGGFHTRSLTLLNAHSGLIGLQVFALWERTLYN
jgi:hypothetical protein